MEANKIQNWNHTTESIGKIAMLLGIAGAVGSLFNMLLGWLGNIGDIAIVAGFMGLSLRLKDLGNLAEPNDAAALKKIELGALLYIVGVAVRIIPVVGWILGPIVLIVAFVFMLLGFSTLKKSETFPNKDGMNLLFIAAIIGVVAAVFKIIPLVGTVIGNILLIGVFVLFLLGWKKVAAPVTDAPVMEEPIVEEPAPEAPAAEEPAPEEPVNEE